MKTYILKVHSIVDLITNSSTETFITANAKTVRHLKDMINSILKCADSRFTADDLFDIELDPAYDSDYGFTAGENYMTINVKPKSADLSKEQTVAQKCAAKLLNSLEKAYKLEEIAN